MANLFLSRHKESYSRKNIVHIHPFKCPFCDQPNLRSLLLCKACHVTRFSQSCTCACKLILFVIIFINSKTHCIYAFFFFYYYFPNGLGDKLKVYFKNAFWVIKKNFLSTSKFVFKSQLNFLSVNRQRSVCSSSTLLNLKFQYVAAVKHYSVHVRYPASC